MLNQSFKPLSIDPATINSRIAMGYNFDFGNYLSNGFQIFTKEWVKFTLFSVISLFISILSIITIIGPMVVYNATLIGFGTAAQKILRNEPISMSDFFEGYQKLGKLIVLSILQLGSYFILYIPFLLIYFSMIGMIYSDNFDGVVNPIFSIILVAYYPVLYIGIFFISGALFFAPYLIFYGNYGVTESIKISYKLFKKNWLLIILFVLVMSILANIGVLVCGIGAFASFAMMGICYFMAMKDIILTNESEIDQIGQIH